MKKFRSWQSLLSGLAGLYVLWLVISKKSLFPMDKSKSFWAYEVFRELLKIGFVPETSKMIVAQAAHETGNFSSRIFLENNNLFGMKVPRIRPNKVVGEKYNHAVYATIEDSITDYSMYWGFVKMPGVFQTIENFVDMLKTKAYFEDSKENYFKGVNYFYNLYWNEEEQ